MEMTFDQYIQNPMGIANAVISNRQMYRILYVDKLDKILVRESGKIDHTLYKDKDRYIAYLKIPSEVIANFYYDVLIEFRPPKHKVTGATLKDYLVRFYSNDPSFVYTFTHAFVKNNMFFTDFKGKMSQKAIKNAAKEKNPKDQVGYVKSLYFAYLYMSKHGLFTKVRYMEKYNLAAIQRDVMDAEKKIALRQEAQAKLSMDKKKAKARAERDAKDFIQKDLSTTAATKTNIGANYRVGKVAKTGTINSIKSTGNIKKTPKK